MIHFVLCMRIKSHKDQQHFNKTPLNHLFNIFQIFPNL